MKIILEKKILIIPNLWYIRTIKMTRAKQKLKIFCFEKSFFFLKIENFLKIVLNCLLVISVECKSEVGNFEKICRKNDQLFWISHSPFYTTFFLSPAKPRKIPGHFPKFFDEISIKIHLFSFSDSHDSFLRWVVVSYESAKLSKPIILFWN